MSRQQIRILFIVLSIAGLFFGVLALAVAHPQFFRDSGQDDSVRTPMISSPAPLANSSARGPIQNVRFTVYDAGIYPRQLRAKPGIVAIVLEDHTRRRPALVIEREVVGGRLPIAGISFLLNQSRARSEFRLEVGRYQVSDATNPANQAELIVEQ
jgi:hypothetical protein